MLQILLAIKYLIIQSKATLYVYYISYITYFDDMFRESYSHHQVFLIHARNVARLQC
jgi:hypothetical protein